MRVVLLGTGTAVGKTTVACSLLRSFAGRGIAVTALKPIETGHPADSSAGPAAGSDAAKLEQELFHVKQPHRPHPLFAFPDPLSPHLAAHRAGRTISLHNIVQWVAEAESPANAVDPHITLIESAGGAFSPLTLTLTNIDLARDLKPELVLLVAPDRLGVLHEVGSTLRAMAATWRLPDCVLVVPSAATDESSGTNAQQLSLLHPGQLVLQFAPEAAESLPLIALIADRLALTRQPAAP